MTRHRLAAATATLALILTLAAPADDKPAPPSSGTTTKGGVPNAAIVGAIQKPDLAVSFEGSGLGLPTGFTVKNIGSADSKACVLKVTATLVPPVPPPSTNGGCPSFFTPQECANLHKLGSPPAGIQDGTTAQLEGICGNPYPDFVYAIPALKPGESKTFMKDKGPYQVSLTGFTTPVTSAQSTNLKSCPLILLCVWDVTAVADAANENDERSKANNTATKRSLREVSFK